MKKKATRKENRKTKDENLYDIYIQQIKVYPLLDYNNEQDLAKQAHNGNKEALHKLVNSNLRLVIKIARAYITKDVPIMDLIQEGNMGLMHAAGKFDYKKNIRFSTYASWWIRQFISRYLTNKRRMVRLPQRKEEILRKVQCTYHTLSQTLMHQPRTDDIANKLGISVQDINFILNMSSGPLPLELSTNKDDKTVIIDIHEDYTYCPERNLFKKYNQEKTWLFLNRLKEREKQVITYRYQLNDSKIYTLKEISNKMAISPETVRQIEMKALAKIRRHADEIKKFDLMEAI